MDATLPGLASEGSEAKGWEGRRGLLELVGVEAEEEEEEAKKAELGGVEAVGEGAAVEGRLLLL